MKYKLLVADFDGTLLNSKHQVTNETIKAVNEFMSEGGFFTIATGRRYSSVKLSMGELKVNAPIICFQGAQIVDNATEEVVSNIELSNEAATKCAIWLEERGVYFQLFIGDKMYVQRSCDITRWYCEICHTEAVETLSPLSEFIKSTNKNVFKILVIADEAKTPIIVKELEDSFSDECSMLMSRSDFIEIISNKTNKAAGIEYLCKMLSIKQSESVAIGDSLNDLSMIEYAGLGIAMGNAFEEIKSVADVITETNDDDGVAKAIYRYCLKEKNDE